MGLVRNAEDASTTGLCEPGSDVCPGLLVHACWIWSALELCQDEKLSCSLDSAVSLERGEEGAPVLGHCRVVSWNRPAYTLRVKGDGS